AFAFINSFRGQVSFCLPGAQWRYFFFEGGTHESVNANVIHLNDTISGTDTIKVLKYYSFFKIFRGSMCNKLSIKQKGDTIFMRNCNTSGTWQILYNYACLPGQYWVTTVKDSMYSGSDSKITYTITVNSVSTATINNISLKKLHVSRCYVSNTNTYTCDTLSIYERIGCMPYLFYFINYNTAGYDYPAFSDFLCYQDGTFNQMSFSANGCNKYAGIKENSLNDTEVKVYPIPGTSVLNVDFKNIEAPYSFNGAFYDVSSREAKRIKLEQSTNKLDISELEDGLYLLKIEDPVTKLNYQIKVVKQR
ncbi:MAG: T9SS type A sorting domain-containing protein, partial [Bacteroidia bacterium]